MTESHSTPTKTYRFFLSLQKLITKFEEEMHQNCHCVLRKRTRHAHVGLHFPKSLELAARTAAVAEAGHHLYLRPI